MRSLLYEGSFMRRIAAVFIVLLLAAYPASMARGGGEIPGAASRRLAGVSSAATCSCQAVCKTSWAQSDFFRLLQISSWSYQGSKRCGVGSSRDKGAWTQARSAFELLEQRPGDLQSHPQTRPSSWLGWPAGLSSAEGQGACPSPDRIQSGVSSR